MHTTTQRCADDGHVNRARPLWAEPRSKEALFGAAVAVDCHSTAGLVWPDGSQLQLLVRTMTNKSSPMRSTPALTMAEVGPDTRLADLGCGDGRVLIAAARHCARCVGYEYDRARCQVARHRVGLQT